jgi:hypothetical protein
MFSMKIKPVVPIKRMIKTKTKTFMNPNIPFCFISLKASENYVLKKACEFFAVKLK